MSQNPDRLLRTQEVSISPQQNWKPKIPTSGMKQAKQGAFLLTRVNPKTQSARVDRLKRSTPIGKQKLSQLTIASHSQDVSLMNGHLATERLKTQIHHTERRETDKFNFSIPKSQLVGIFNLSLFFSVMVIGRLDSDPITKCSQLPQTSSYPHHQIYTIEGRTSRSPPASLRFEPQGFSKRATQMGNC